MKSMRASMAFDPATCERVDGVPVAFRIWKWGENPTDKGQTILTTAAMAKLLEEQDRRGNRYSFDCDHMSLSPVAPIDARKGLGSHLLASRVDGLWAVDCRFVDYVAEALKKDPPEWLYFSPAYDVDEKTFEPVSYLNTALTNNPATWHVTALATRSAQEQRMDLNAFLAALQELIAKAQTPVAAAEAPAAAPAAPAAEPVKAAEPPPAAPAKEPDGDECKATITASAVDLGLVARVHALESELSKRNEAEERVRLLASRKDFGADTLKSLEKASIENVRFAVATFPKSANLAAVVNVQATRGEGQGETVSALPADEAEQLKIRMGVKETVRACRKAGNVMTFGVSVPKEIK